MHIDDIEKVQALDVKRRKLMACFSTFDRLKGMDFRLIADYEHASNGGNPWTSLPFIPIHGSVARDICVEQLQAVEARMRALGVETAPRERSTP